MRGKRPRRARRSPAGGPTAAEAPRVAATARPVRATVLLIGAALLLAGCAIGGDEPGQLPQDSLNPAGPGAEVADDLWNIVFPIAVAVFVLVQGALIYLMIRFRDRGQSTPPRQITGHTRLEIAWTIIPALILAGISVPTVAGIFELADKPDKDKSLDVRVVAKQFWFGFEYLGDEGQDVITANELHIPTGRPVQLTLEALNPQAPDTFDESEPEGSRAEQSLEGVIHSFWVPRLAGKQDVIPGYQRNLTLEADEPGTYEGQCAEFCGLGHSEMRFEVVAHEPQEFQNWLDEQSQPADSDLDGLAAEGQKLFGQNCVQCHTIEGHPENADVRIGPNLTHFASRDQFAGAVFDVDNREQLAAWLRDPAAEKQGAQMPNLGLSEDDIDALVEYLYTLE